MNPSVDELFHATADLSPADRARYFEDHSVSPDLRREVEQLLACDHLGEIPIAEAIAQVAAQTAGAFDATGHRYGPFLLTRLVGAGGMGVVYEARRDDGELQQRAAVKLLRPDIIFDHQERFIQERQILSGLSHPNIARLLDAGRGPDGRPFLAMEFVEGQPLDTFAASLTLKEKLRLFLRVCAAVSYLHRNLVVHRDLKPSNILVTNDGEPKLLDFGIAKIISTASDSTVTGLRMLTPDYASPEQASGTPVSTSSDIYSLAAVLFRLLTGQSPHRFHDSSAISVAAVIAQHDVPRPSSLAPELKGDLDSILLKALRKQPSERYTTVEQLADDIQAFLSSQPIRARQGEWLYAARKFVRRYWVPVTAAGVAFAGLATGLVIANHQRAIAERRFNEVRQLSTRLFEIDRQVSSLPGGVKVRRYIMSTSVEYLQKLRADAMRDPDLALDVGAAYHLVARGLGVPGAVNLGQTAESEKNLIIAEELVRYTLSQRPQNRAAMIRFAQILHDRLSLSRLIRSSSDEVPLARQTQLWVDRYVQSGPIPPEEKEKVVRIGTNVANYLMSRGLTAEALALLRRVIEISNATGQPIRVGLAQLVVGRTLRNQGDLEGALAALQDAVRALQPAPNETNAQLLSSYQLAVFTHGQILWETPGNISLGRKQDATVHFRHAYDLAQQALRRDAANAENRLARSLSGLRLAASIRDTSPQEALSIYEDILRTIEPLNANPRARRDTVRALAGSSYPLRALGRSAQARNNLDRAFALLAQMKAYPASVIVAASSVDEALIALADFHISAGNLPAASNTLRELYTGYLAGKPQPEVNLNEAEYATFYRSRLADLHRRMGNQAEAATLEAQHRTLWQNWQAKLPASAFVRSRLASTL